MTKKINIIIIVVLAILLVMEVILVKNNSFIQIDNYIYNNISKFINPFNTAIFKFFSFFGSEIFIIGLCILILILVKEKSRGIGFIFILSMSLLLNQGLKLVIGRDRPNINQIVNETSFSKEGITKFLETKEVETIDSLITLSQENTKHQKQAKDKVLSLKKQEPKRKCKGT